MSTLFAQGGAVVPDGTTMDIFESYGNLHTGATPGDYEVTLIAIEGSGATHDLMAEVGIPENTDVQISHVRKWNDPIVSIVGPTVVMIGWRNELGSVGALANLPHSCQATYRMRPS